MCSPLADEGAPGHAGLQELEGGEDKTGEPWRNHPTKSPPPTYKQQHNHRFKIRMVVGELWQSDCFTKPAILFYSQGMVNNRIRALDLTNEIARM